MKPDIATLGVHAVCIAVIAGCFALGHFAFASQPEVSQVLIAAGFWLWGKLGFKPASPVVDRIVQALGPQEVERIVSMRPVPSTEKGVQP